MTGLVKFLNARLTEDEALAQQAGEPDDHWQWRRNDDGIKIVGKDGSHTPDGGLSWHPNKTIVIFSYWEEDGEHIERWAPHRVLREVEAKRRIVGLLAPPDPHEPGKCSDCDVIYLLALPYADHEDYRQEWAP